MKILSLGSTAEKGMIKFKFLHTQFANLNVKYR